MRDWEDFVNENHAGHLVDTVAVKPGELDGRSAHRLYLSTLGEASTKLDTIPLPVSEAALAKWLEQAPENKRALFVVAAAVHSAIHPEDEVVRYSGREVVRELAKRERYRLHEIAQDCKAYDPEFLARLLTDSRPCRRRRCISHSLPR